MASSSALASRWGGGVGRSALDSFPVFKSFKRLLSSRWPSSSLRTRNGALRSWAAFWSSRCRCSVSYFSCSRSSAVGRGRPTRPRRTFTISAARATIRRTAPRPAKSHERLFPFAGTAEGSSAMPVVDGSSRGSTAVSFEACGSLSVDTLHLAHPIAELQEEALLSWLQHAVDDVVLALVGVLDRFELLFIVALASVDHGPLLQLGELNVSENAVVGNLADREVAVVDLVAVVDREEQLLPDLARLLFERSAAARFGGFQLVFRQLPGFASNSLVEELQVARLHHDQLIHVARGVGLRREVKDKEPVVVGVDADRRILVVRERRDDADGAVRLRVEALRVGHHEVGDLPSFGKPERGPDSRSGHDRVDLRGVVAVEVADERPRLRSGRGAK